MPSKRKRSLLDHLRQEIHAQIDHFDSLWPGFEDEHNEQTPHKQRSTTNRLFGYAVFLGLPTGKKEPGAEYFRAVKAWQKELGTVRDLDVARQWLEKIRAESPDTGAAAAQELDLVLLERRQRFWQALGPDARGLPGAETRVALHHLREQFDQTIDALRARESFDQREALLPVLALWQERLAVLQQHQADEELHSFRVANKRLRFVVDVLVGGSAGRQRKELAERAEVLGDIHTTLGNLSDLRVMRDEIRLQRARWAAAGDGLDESASALEEGRAALERGELLDWFRRWPVICQPDFIAGMC